MRPGKGGRWCGWQASGRCNQYGRCAHRRVFFEAARLIGNHLDIQSIWKENIIFLKLSENLARSEKEQVIYVGTNNSNPSKYAYIAHKFDRDINNEHDNNPQWIWFK